MNELFEMVKSATDASMASFKAGFDSGLEAGRREVNRDLLEACKTFAEWLRREEAGSTDQPWHNKRDTPEGERLWREWYDENLRICALAQEQVHAALAQVKS